MGYQHLRADGSLAGLPVGKVVCVGRNYAAHAAELGNEVPEEPILFIKPATSLVPFQDEIHLPGGRGACHFETEVAVLVGHELEAATAAQVRPAIAGIGIGLDLTLRDIQNRLKEKGHPWERAKAFDGACPLSPFSRPDAVADLAAMDLRLEVNGEVRQQGNSGQMLFPVVELIAHISHWFRLVPGDVVLTGTPAGVGPLAPGDRLRAEIEGVCAWETRVAA